MQNVLRFNLQKCTCTYSLIRDLLSILGPGGYNDKIPKRWVCCIDVIVISKVVRGGKITEFRNAIQMVIQMASAKLKLHTWCPTRLNRPLNFGIVIGIGMISGILDRMTFENAWTQYQNSLSRRGPPAAECVDLQRRKSHLSDIFGTAAGMRFRIWHSRVDKEF